MNKGCRKDMLWGPEKEVSFGFRTITLVQISEYANVLLWLLFLMFVFVDFGGIRCRKDVML